MTAAFMLAVAVLGVWRPAPAVADEEIPQGAIKRVISPEVTLYHWFVPVKGRAAYQLRAVPKVSSWPRGVWGAEVTVTPVPLCCGARQHSVSWQGTDRNGRRMGAGVYFARLTANGQLVASQRLLLLK